MAVYEYTVFDIPLYKMCMDGVPGTANGGNYEVVYYSTIFNAYEYD